MPKKKKRSMDPLAAASETSAVVVSREVAKAKTIVLAEYRGISVGDLSKLRAKAREQGVYLRILKQTLARRSVAGTPFERLADEMTGSLIYGISEDPIAGARFSSELADGGATIKAGSFEGRSLNAEEIHNLANSPKRESLLGRLAYAMRTHCDKLIISDATAIGETLQLSIARSTEMVSAEVFSTTVGTTVQDVERDVLNHRLLAVLDPRSAEFLFPRWQSNESVIAITPQILHIFENFDEWSILHFFKTPSPILLELTPLEALGVESNASVTERAEILKSKANVRALVVSAADDYINGQD